MILNRLTLVILSFLFFYCSNTSAQTGVVYDTTKAEVFKGREDASFKLDYYHTEGYTTRDRFWYEIVIVDASMILNFRSPENTDWNYVTYQKRVELDDSTLQGIKTLLKTLNIGQKRKGIPQMLSSGYGADKLFIESEGLNVSGGTAYMNVGADSTRAAFLERVKQEKKSTSSISGDYEKLFLELERLFTALPVLLKEKDK